MAGPVSLAFHGPVFCQSLYIAAIRGVPLATSSSLATQPMLEKLGWTLPVCYAGREVALCCVYVRVHVNRAHCERIK